MDNFLDESNDECCGDCVNCKTMICRDDFVLADDMSTDDDYPENVDELAELWENGDLNGLAVGDKVRMAYLMNTDGVANAGRFSNQIGTIREINLAFGSDKAKQVLIDWDDETLDREYNWIPHQFTKI